MAKAFARAFYKSAAWRKCRESYISMVFGLCERCQARGKTITGYILHHKVELTPDNIVDPDIALGHHNLEFVCLDCHNVEHGIKAEHSSTRDGLMFDASGQLVQIS